MGLRRWGSHTPITLVVGYRVAIKAFSVSLKNASIHPFLNSASNKKTKTDKHLNGRTHTPH